jgi:hypothetical protein
VPLGGCDGVPGPAGFAANTALTLTTSLRGAVCGHSLRVLRPFRAGLLLCDACTSSTSTREPPHRSHHAPGARQPRPDVAMDPTRYNPPGPGVPGERSPPPPSFYPPQHHPPLPAAQHHPSRSGGAWQHPTACLRVPPKRQRSMWLTQAAGSQWGGVVGGYKTCVQGGHGAVAGHQQPQLDLRPWQQHHPACSSL